MRFLPPFSAPLATVLDKKPLWGLSPIFTVCMSFVEGGSASTLSAIQLKLPKIKGNPAHVLLALYCALFKLAFALLFLGSCGFALPIFHKLPCLLPKSLHVYLVAHRLFCTVIVKGPQLSMLSCTYQSKRKLLTSGVCGKQEKCLFVKYEHMEQ